MWRKVDVGNAFPETEQSFFFDNVQRPLSLRLAFLMYIENNFFKKYVHKSKAFINKWP